MPNQENIPSDIEGVGPQKTSFSFPHRHLIPILILFLFSCARKNYSLQPTECNKDSPILQIRQITPTGTNIGPVSLSPIPYHGAPRS
jgi:hypothetical protein